ncbi:hypothetical protein N7495_001212 [Penicillium taxi]|uniref:uncharacterized protein n=1 Tax=Penicillium taxi TaxID=168475 RepID=UPI0025453560|nr:uncharacterized protein N7495_001212 [Penicillium taxi]KAJ5908530.1 hypothetical protein N7495_001212 [Penicillium taxi]
MFRSVFSAFILSACIGACVNAKTPFVDKEIKYRKENGFYSHLDPEKFVVAAVSAQSNENSDGGLFQSNWDINYTTDKAVSIIKQAAEDGVGLLTFPEVWFPGYPFGLTANPSLTTKYINNSLVEDDANWKKLVAAVKATGIYLAFGFSERQDDYLYMAQALFSPDGEKLIHRHKLRPSGGERNLWSDGLLHSFKVVDTPYGRMGMLECWEHFHPSMTFPMQAQLEDIHIGAFPYLSDLQAVDNKTDLSVVDSTSVNIASLRVYSATSQVHSVSAAINGEFSYGILSELYQSYPSYIPKQTGTFVLHKNNTIQQLEEYAASNTSFFSPEPNYPPTKNSVYYVPPN